MTTQQCTTEDDRRTVPVACTLTSADLAAQRARWERLAARALTERAKNVHGLRLSFGPAHGAEEELRRLVAVEKQCCRWAMWTVETRAGHVVLDIRATGDGIAAVHSMFSSLHPPRRPTRGEDFPAAALC
jgi:hypothetical protein